MNNLILNKIKNNFALYRRSCRQEQKAPLWENIYVFIVLFFSTYAVIPLLQAMSGAALNSAGGSIVLQALWSFFYALTFLLLIMRLPVVIRIAFQNRLIWALLGLAWASMIWSETPVVTFRHCLALSGTTLFGVYLATRYNRQEILKLLVWTLGLVAVLSLGFVLFLPWYGIQQDYYGTAWRGVYIHKNLLGSFMSLSAITSLLYILSRPQKYFFSMFCFFISLVLLIMSDSRTALIIFLTLLFLLFIIQLLRRLNMGVLPAGLLLFFLLGLLILCCTCNLEFILKTLGRDTTLTGRIYLWQAVWLMVQRHPWLGYGYGAFWLGEKGPSKYIWSILPWEPGNAHNGYLDLCLHLGLVGAAVFVVSFLYILFKAFNLVWKNNGLIAMFPLIFLGFLMVHNITESTIMFRNQIFWILYVTFSVQLSNETGKYGFKSSI